MISFFDILYLYKKFTVNLQSRKLHAIQYLIAIQDEKVFAKIEETIYSIKSQNEIVFKPLTKKQLLDRAQKSNEDYVSGRFKTQEQLESASENW